MWNPIICSLAADENPQTTSHGDLRSSTYCCYGVPRHKFSVGSLQDLFVVVASFLRTPVIIRYADNCTPRALIKRNYKQCLLFSESRRTWALV
jgi:hypothetical protein